MTPSVVLRDVGCRAGGVPILAGISLAAEGGQLVAILGRNGAGKSTLLDVIAGVRTRAAGTVLLNGRPAALWPTRARSRLLAHLPQTTAINIPFTALELVSMGRYPHGTGWRTSAADRVAVRHAMQQAGCWDLRARQLPTLSGGECQRIALAACLAQDAEILLLDEPSAHLDLEYQLQCFDTLGALAAKGRLVLVVVHDLNLALTFATRLVGLERGRVAFDLSTDEARRHSDWLGFFSSRFRLGRTDTGFAWVTFA